MPSPKKLMKSHKNHVVMNPRIGKGGAFKKNKLLKQNKMQALGVGSGSGINLNFPAPPGEILSSF
jgi:hypothetical protein